LKQAVYFVVNMANVIAPTVQVRTPLFSTSRLAVQLVVHVHLQQSRVNRSNVAWVSSRPVFLHLPRI